MTHTRPSRRRTSVVVAALLAALANGCAPSGSEPEADTVVEISLEAGFRIDPALIEVPAGTVAIEVTNTDPDLEHDLALLGMGTRRLAPGQSQRLFVGTVGEGLFRMWCDVPGHREAGQVGLFQVVARPDDAA